jgi:hypothetical protein
MSGLPSAIQPETDRPARRAGAACLSGLRKADACLHAHWGYHPFPLRRLPALPNVSKDEHIQAAVTKAGLRIGKVAVGWAIGKALEANGLSLLAALI